MPTLTGGKREEGKEEPPPSSFHPDQLFHIPPHYGVSKLIKVFDITGKIASDFGTNEFKEATKALCGSYKEQTKKERDIDAERAYMTAQKAKWYSKTFSIALPTTQPGVQVAEWHGGTWSISKNTVNFAADSEHCSHAITVGVDNFLKFRERFVVDSVPYLWVCNNLWSMVNFSLYKCVGPEKIMVGRYWQPFKLFQTAGVLALDTAEIDAVVGVLTCLVILRKKRQRDAEHRS